MYAGLGGLATCYWMFSSIREPNLVCQTAMVSACVKMGDFTFARKLFDKMPYKDLTPLKLDMVKAGIFL